VRVLGSILRPCNEADSYKQLWLQCHAPLRYTLTPRFALSKRYGRSITKRDPDTDAISMLAVIPDLQMGVCVVVLITVGKQAATRHGLFPTCRVCMCVSCLSLNLASMPVGCLSMFLLCVLSHASPRLILPELPVSVYGCSQFNVMWCIMMFNTTSICHDNA
jgi:hypothetical protein